MHFADAVNSKQVRRFQEKRLNLDITEEELLEIEKVASDYLAFTLLLYRINQS